MAQIPYLIFGETGQVARALKAELGENALCAGRDVADFMQPESCVALIEKLQPKVIINAVAYTQVDNAETEEAVAMQVNAHTPAAIADAAKKAHIPFVHYSTDYVFDGVGDTPFTEDMPTAPLNAYGRSKLAGEQAIQAVGGDALIFRTSWVFDGEGKNFLTTMLRLAKERTSLKVVADQIGAPSFAPHLARTTLQALQAALALPVFPSGIYHMCNAGETSWHGFACEIFEEARQAGIALMLTECLPIPATAYPTPAKRPYNSRLDCSKLRDKLGVTLPTWQEAVREGIVKCT